MSVKGVLTIFIAESQDWFICFIPLCLGAKFEFGSIQILTQRSLCFCLFNNSNVISFCVCVCVCVAGPGNNDWRVWTIPDTDKNILKSIVGVSNAVKKIVDQFALPGNS